MVKNGHRRVARLGFRPRGRQVGLEVVSWSELKARGGPPRWPHRADFHTLLLLDDGRLPFGLDFVEADRGPRSLLWARPGQVQQFGRPQAVRGQLLLFVAEFPAPSEALVALLGGPRPPSSWTLTPEQHARASETIEDPTERSRRRRNPAPAVRSTRAHSTAPLARGTHGPGKPGLPAARRLRAPAPGDGAVIHDLSTSTGLRPSTGLLDQDADPRRTSRDRIDRQAADRRPRDPRGKALTRAHQRARRDPSPTNSGSPKRRTSPSSSPATQAKRPAPSANASEAPGLIRALPGRRNPASRTSTNRRQARTTPARPASGLCNPSVRYRTSKCGFIRAHAT